MAQPRGRLKAIETPVGALTAEDVVAASPISMLVIDDGAVVQHANAAAEMLLNLSAQNIVGRSLQDVLAMPDGYVGDDAPFAAYDASLRLRKGAVLRADVFVTPFAEYAGWKLVSMYSGAASHRVGNRAHGGGTRAAVRIAAMLAHEIKNPLGGIRGAAQLLEFELPDKGLREYTQVIIKESDRLQTLVDRLLAPHRKAHVMESFNVHEALERVRSLVLAEFPKGLKIIRNYDTSLPDVLGDREQLIQATLNIVHNAAQALSEEIQNGVAQIELKTRVARSVTIAKHRYKLAMDLHVIDNGPGIPEEIIERIFFPLVSGREGGSGLGLTLAQTFVQQHQGFIACNSRPGRTDFHIQIPYRRQEKAS